MSTSLSLAARLQKNKRDSIYPWMFLVDIDFGSNNVPIISDNKSWTWRGKEYIGFQFGISELVFDGTGEIPTVSLQVSNLNGLVMRYIRASNGGQDATLTLRIVNALTMELGECYFEEVFAAGGIPYDDRWITIKLDTDYILTDLVPPDRYERDFCGCLRDGGYGGTKCGVLDAIKAQYPTCNGTLTQCRQRGNSHRWGACPGIPGGDQVGS